MKTVLLTDEELRELISQAVREAMSSAQVRTLEPLYTFKQACDLLSKDEHTLYRWSKQGVIKTTAIGGARYVTGQSIADIINH